MWSLDATANGNMNKNYNNLTCKDATPDFIISSLTKP